MDRRPLFAALALIAAILAIWLLRPAAPGAPPAAEAPAPPPAAVLPREAPPLEQLPAPRGWAELSCPLPVTVTRWERIEVLVEDDGGEPIATAADLGPDLLRFRGPVPDGVGLVTLPGFEQAGVVWFTDAQGEVDCLFPRDPEPLPHGVLRLPAPGDQATFDSVFYQVCGAGLNHGVSRSPFLRNQ